MNGLSVQLAIERAGCETQALFWSGKSPMLQVAHALANETIEDAAIALLEAESVDVITCTLLETCLARSAASRGVVCLVADGTMEPAASSFAGARRDEFLLHVQQAVADGEPASFRRVSSACEEVTAPVTSLVLPFRQRSQTVGALYVEYDDCRQSVDPQT